jgi:hypothetical protein
MENEFNFRSSKFSKSSNPSEKITIHNKNRLISIEEFKRNLLTKDIEGKSLKSQTKYFLQKPLPINPNKTTNSFLSKNSSMPNLFFFKNNFNETTSMTGSHILNFEEKREKDIPILMSHYHNNLSVIDYNDPKKKQEKGEYFYKYKIDPRLSDKEKNEIKKIIKENKIKNNNRKPNSYSQIEFFKNPYKSNTNLKMNKLIINRVNDILNEVQIKKYTEEYEIVYNKFTKGL